MLQWFLLIIFLLNRLILSFKQVLFYKKLIVYNHSLLLLYFHINFILNKNKTVFNKMRIANIFGTLDLFDDIFKLLRPFTSTEDLSSSFYR